MTINETNLGFGIGRATRNGVDPESRRTVQRLRHVVHAELRKLLHPISAAIVLVAVPLLCVFYAAVLAWQAASGYADLSAPEQALFDPTLVALKGSMFAGIFACYLGSNSFGGEYATGQIRSTLTTVPRRGRLLLGKTLALTPTITALGIVGSAAAWLVGQALIMNLGGPAATLSGDVARAIVGAGLNIGLSSLIGMSFGILTRNNVGAVALYAATVIGMPSLFGASPGAIGEWFATWWPSAAGLQILTTVPQPGSLDPWTGWAVFAAATAVLAAISAVVFVRKDP